MLKPFLTKWSFLFKFRLFLGAVLLILILIFLYLKVVPFGQITYRRDWPRGLATGKGFIYDFKPAERLATSTAGYLSGDQATKDSLIIIAEPIYFSLFTPRAFDHAVMTITYRDHLSSTTPIIEAGVLRDKISNFYDLQPVQNNVLDKLSFSWPRLEDAAGRLILQAEKNYSSVAEFDRDLKDGNLKDCPVGEISSCVALYNYSLPLNYHLPAGQPLSPLTINQPLRGAHQFYVYFNGPWTLNFDLADLNLDQAADPITVNVSFNNQVIASQTLPDENQAPTGGQPENRAMALKRNSPAGVYKVDLKVSDDIVINKIESSSNKLSFINKIWPVSGKGNLILFTDVNNLQAQTSSPASLQTINFAGRPSALSETYKQFDFSAPEGTSAAGAVKEIRLAKDDVVLAGNGVFSFSPDSLFDPDFPKIDRYFSPAAGAKYIIADYQTPIIKDGLKTAQVKFNLSDAYRENGKYTFLISVPGLEVSAGADNYLEIKEIKIKLAGKTLGEKIRELFGKL